MSTLTQVWVFTLFFCATVLVTGFKLAGRMGLLLSFAVCAIYAYLFFHRGLKTLFSTHLKKYKEKSPIQPFSGSDVAGLHKLINETKTLYNLKSVQIYYTEENTLPLLWRDFFDQGHIIVNSNLVMRLNPDEKLILAHWLLAHLSTHSLLARRFFAILYLSFSPASRFFVAFFNFMAFIFRFENEIYGADLLALKNSRAQVVEYCLFLRKLHNFKLHRQRMKRGEKFFTPLSFAKRSTLTEFVQLSLAPGFDKRTQRILGYST